MRALLLLALTLLFVAMPGLEAEAQQTEAAGHLRGFKLYSAALTAGVDDGIITDEGTVEDNVLSFVPLAIAYRSRSPRGDFQFIYEPEFEAFETHSELNAWNQAAALAYSLDVTPDFNLRAGGSFLHTHDRSRQSSSVLLTPRGLFVEGRAYLSATYRISRDTNINLAISSSLTETPGSASATGSIDEVTSTLTAGVSRSFDSIHQISVNYSHLTPTLLNPEDLPSDNFAVREGQDTLGAGYTLSFPSGLGFAGSVGAIRLPQETGSDQYTYALSGQVDKSWNAVTLSGGYTRSLSGLLQLDAADPADQIRDPLLSGSVAERADVTFTGQLGRRLRIDQRVGVSRTFLRITDERLDAIFTSFYAEFVVADRLVPFVTAWYWDQNATEFTRSVSRTRVTAGLRFYWDSPETVPVRSEHESVRSILPITRAR